MAVAISVDPKVLSRILHSESGVNTLIGLELDGGSTRVLVKDYQLDPIDHKLLHADFYQVAMDKMMTVTVPIVLKGEARASSSRGASSTSSPRNRDRGAAGRHPREHHVDVCELMLNQGIRVRDLHTEGAKWKPVSDPDTMIVHVVALKVEEEPAAAEARRCRAGAPAEPEVIKKGKPDKEEEK